MTRRQFIGMAAAIRSSAQPRLRMPLHRITDVRVRSLERLHYFWSNIWPEAVRDFSQGGIDLQTSDGAGEVGRSPGDMPIFKGLRRGVINLVLTDYIPADWDNGHSLAGVSTLYQGYPVCMVALRHAHGNQIPFLSVNTCVHELLHALMQDIFVSRPKWYQSGGRELRIDWHATCLWLFHDGEAIRRSGQAYLDRLRAAGAGRT